MGAKANLAHSILATWKTSNRITIFLIENLPKELWLQKVPGYARKTVQMIGGHLHNTRCMWVKMVGKRFGIAVPESVDRYRVSQHELISALRRSSQSILELLEKGIERDDTLPGFSLDVVHFLNYLVAHEAHHRGQIIMLARQLDYKLPDEVTYGVWQWTKRAQEV